MDIPCLDKINKISLIFSPFHNQKSTIFQQLTVIVHKQGMNLGIEKLSLCLGI